MKSLHSHINTCRTVFRATVQLCAHTTGRSETNSPVMQQPTPWLGLSAENYDTISPA